MDTKLGEIVFFHFSRIAERFVKCKNHQRNGKIVKYLINAVFFAIINKTAVKKNNWDDGNLFKGRS